MRVTLHRSDDIGDNTLTMRIPDAYAAPGAVFHFSQQQVRRVREMIGVPDADATGEYTDAAGHRYELVIGVELGDRAVTLRVEAMRRAG